MTSETRLAALAAAATGLQRTASAAAALEVVARAAGADAAVVWPGSAGTVDAVSWEGAAPERPAARVPFGEVEDWSDADGRRWRVAGLPGGGALALAGGPDEPELLTALAALLEPALAVASASALVQRALLPEALPRLPSIELAAHYAAGSAGGGGDWYDAFELPDGRLGLAVGDTMGRGVGAAARMGQVRAALRAYALEGHPPAEVLRLLDAFVRTFDEAAFTTCAYVRYDPESRRLSAATAGHVPPLVLEADGTGAYLDLDPGVPLGAGTMRQGFSVDHVSGLAVDATVVLLTDGVLGAGVDDGLARVRAAAAGAAGGGAEAVATAVAAVAAPGAADDVALVAMRARSQSPTSEDGTRSLDVELPPSVHAARVARARVLAALADWGHGGSDDAGGPGAFEAVDAVVLLTDELVTNAVLHAQSALRLQLQGRRDVLRVSVTDESPRLPAPRHQEPMAEGGRGLRLVELLASRWGVDPLPLGKRIWFEVDLAAG
ncbi:ATP-binding SpoIIE family protein phosphatase [Motilibacter rhizosphaerae]|uniref:ATP-binding SpoIIE family protein phosphatase n=1 Tax=Motilibacter rhizosphaerae TaxID=598652 RepID=UPI00102C3BE8|nr:ATP-binding SpoIIE family protein phosphatase [Motilibacter rhizosphaerae]